MKKKTTEGATEEEILQRLSERVDRAVKMIQELRRERDELKEKLASFDGDRSEIRSRIESILASLEQLDQV
ncbi:MAG TPA: hypothetical protein VLU46_16130 [Thermoanaerobaculia bacterium]|nr:hypothetical protein [Thermoanaerobaculia bacterium]